MLSGILALAGVIVGVVLKAVFDRWTEKERHSREDRIRFITEKRECYAQFMVLVDELIKYQVSQAKDPGRLVPLVQEMTAQVMVMRLVAPHGLAELAHACLRASLAEGRSRAEELEGKFQHAARKDLEGETVDYEELDSAALHHREH